MSTVEIVMYSTTYCPYCELARALLRQKGLMFREIKVDDDPSQREVMMRKSGGRRTVPQIFIGGRHVGGFDDMNAMERTGELDQWLKSA